MKILTKKKKKNYFVIPAMKARNNQLKVFLQKNTEAIQYIKDFKKKIYLKKKLEKIYMEI